MRKVLVITYYWPPAGGPGVQRWLKFVKYLRDFGIDPVVYIPENPNYPIKDSSLIDEIPVGVKIYMQAIREPYRLASFVSSNKARRISSGIIQTKNQSVLEKAMLWVRGNFFIPDARKNWVKPSINYLTEIIATEAIDTVITTGPPHSLHLIGLGLKQGGQLKWVADFRDPWTTIGYHKKLKLTNSSKKRHKQLERQVLNDADAIVVTSSTTKKEFQMLTSVPIHVITNGYDVEVNQSTELDTKFTISHIGSLLTGRNPDNLWTILSQLTQENEAFKNVFELHLTGVVSKDVLDNIYGHGLEPYVHLVDYLSHDAAVKRQQESQVLLLVEINSPETTGIIPGKVFEYLAAKRPILAIGPKEWDAGDVINECKAGHVFDYQNREELKNVLLGWFTAYQNGELQIASQNIEKYSRKALTNKLAEIL